MVKRITSFLLAFALVMTMTTPALAAPQNNLDEISGHWAEAQLTKWIEKGYLQGYNGFYYPDRPITRAEFAALINRSFNLTQEAEINFIDLKDTHWAYPHIAIAVQANYIQGYSDHTVRPDQKITREEAAVMVYKLLKIENGTQNATIPFKDHAAISDWSKEAVLALSQNSIIKGRGNGNFDPQGHLTRAEAVTLLESALNYAASQVMVYDTPGQYGPDTGVAVIKGSVIVASPGVTLRNVIIEGDLTVAETVGDGDAYFKNVSVRGTTYIYGGGPESVHFEDSVLVWIWVDKRDGIVRVVASGNTVVEYVEVHSPVKLEESSLTNSGFANVEISEGLPENSEVQLIGQFEDVSVLASNIRITIPSGTIDNLNVGENAGNTEIEVNDEAKIIKLVLNAIVKILGGGKIEHATVNEGAFGSEFQTAPETIDGAGANQVIITNGSGNNVTGGNSSGSNSPNDFNPPNNDQEDEGTSGNENGGNNGNPSSCQTVEECRDARLTNISIEGYTLNQLDANLYSTGETGFDPTVLAYSVVTDPNMSESQVVSMTVTKAPYARAYYGIYNKGQKLIKSGIINDDPIYLEIKPKEDLMILITVMSADGINTKVYDLYIRYPKTIQEAFKINTLQSYYVTDNNETVLLTSYHLYRGELKGEKIQPTDTVRVYESNSDTPFLECSFLTCRIPDDKLLDKQGVWYIEVERNGQLIDAGEYRYDLSEAPVLTDDIGLNVRLYTKEELNEMNHLNPWPYRSGWEITADKNKFERVFPNVKYASVHVVSMAGVVTSFPPGRTIEDFKLVNWWGGIDPIYSNDEIVTIMRSSSLGYSDYPVSDEFIFIGLYDEDFQLVGQYITVADYDQDHVPDGYIAEQNWQPES